MADDTFGARVRRHREKRGISLDSIATQTKIKASLLGALERGDISQWPSGIFRRAYVRAYAQAIGLDVEATVREFLELYPDPVEVLPPPPPPEPTRLRRLFDSAFGPLSRRRQPLGPEPATEPPRSSLNSALQPPPPGASPVSILAPPPVPGPQAVAGPQPVAGPRPPAPKEEPTVDLFGAARLCTQLGRVAAGNELIPLLREAAKLLGARGLIVWTANASAGELRPAIIHGYSDKVRARLRPVKPDDDNATAAAFTSMETRAVASHETGRSALAVPLLSAAGCAGVLAIELPQDRAEIPAVQAMATFIAAVLAQLISGPDGGERGERSAQPDTGSRRERRGRGADRGARNADNGARTA